MHNSKQSSPNNKKTDAITFMSAMFQVLFESIKNSKLLSFFYNYSAIEKKFKNSILHEKLSKLELIKYKFLSAKINFAKKSEQSILLNIFDNLAHRFFSSSVRSFGVFLLSFGGVLLALNVATHTESILEFNFSQTFVFCCFLIILSFFMLPVGKKKLATVLKASPLFSYIFSDTLYIKHLFESDSTDTLHVSSFSLFYGLICGVISHITTPKLIIFAIIFVFIIYLIGTRPENGVIITCFALPFFTEKFLTFTIVFTVLAQMFKITRGKRSMHFNICSGCLLITALITVSACVVSFDKQGAFSSSLHIFLSILFAMFVIMIINSSNLAKKCLKMLAFSSILTSLLAISRMALLYLKEYSFTDTFINFSKTGLPYMFTKPENMVAFLVATMPIFFLRKKTTSGFLSAFALTIGVISLIFMNSYSGIIALVASLVFAMIVFKKLGLWIMAIILSIVYMVIKFIPNLIPLENIENYLRVFNENKYLISFNSTPALRELFSKFWSYGIGAGNNYHTVETYLPDNDVFYYSGFGETPVNVSIHLGIPLTILAVVLMLVFIIRILSYALSNKVSSDTKTYSSVIITSLFAIFSFSLYTNILMDYKTTFLVFLLLSLGSAVADSSDNDYILPGTVREDIY